MEKLALLVITLFALSSQAMTFKDVTMPDEDKVAGKKLVLNGMALREVNVMGIDVNVYVGGFYINKKTTNATDVINSKSAKKMKMHFLRRVSEGDYKKTWKGIFKDRCDKSCEKFQDKIDAFVSLLKEVKKDEELNYTFNGKILEIDSSGLSWGKVESQELVQFILTSWFGEKTSDPNLKAGLLGSK